MFKAARATGLTYPTERVVQAVDVAGTLATCTVSGSPSAFLPFAAGFKITRLRIWQPWNSVNTDAGALLANTCGVLWEGDGTQFYSAQWKQSTALDLSQPGYLDVHPPSQSAASEWLFPSSNEIMRIQVDSNAIVLLDVVMSIYQGGQPNNPPVVTVGSPANVPVLGALHRLPLDYASGGSICLFPMNAWIQVVTP